MHTSEIFFTMMTARAAAFRLIASSPRPISGVGVKAAPHRPGGAGRRGASKGRAAAGRAATVLALRFGGGKG